MRKYWFGIDEKVRFAIMASVNMALRFMIFSGLALLFSPERYQLLLAATWFISGFSGRGKPFAPICKISADMDLQLFHQHSYFNLPD